MAKKISVQTLIELMRDPKTDQKTLAKYFVLDEARSGFFRPFVTYNAALVDVGKTSEARVRSEAALPFLNGIERAKRRAAFELRLIQGYSGPVIVSEGDSWFQFPLLLLDVVDVLAEPYAISSLDAAGDTLDLMLAQDEYLDEIERRAASILLFSGGGNDVLGGGDLKTHLRPFDPKLKPDQHIRSSYSVLLDHVIGLFDQIYRRVAREAPGVQIVTHGYDYAIPRGGNALGKPMAELGIDDAAFQKAIVAVLVDRFATAMTRLAARYPHVHFLDNRGKVSNAEWFDELHPDNSGFAKVASSFAKKIDEISRQPASDARPRGRSVPVPRSRDRRRVIGAKGISLHIGLNKIDPHHYGSDCMLYGCHNDARSMAAIASDRGYETAGILLDADADAKAVTGAIKQAAKVLKNGDIFVLTYSGHGGSVPDFSGDEKDDGRDETWCLFDRQLLDDELYELYELFDEGVRVLVVSDSCNSGTVVRSTSSGLTTIDSTIPGALPSRVRALPSDSRRYAINTNLDFYRKIQVTARASAGGRPSTLRNLREIDRPLSCTVRLLSACLDNQVSADGDLNGLFTGRLLHVVENGFDGNYAKFHRELRRMMPDSQTPGHLVIGRKDPGFDSQRPFDI
jgi:lysophospholipase L1-like esterase